MPAWVSVIDARTAMGRGQVQAQQGGMEDRIKRRGPGVRVCRSGEGSSCPSKGRASLVEILGRNVGRSRYARIREELFLLRLVRDVDFWLCGGIKFCEGRNLCGAMMIDFLLINLRADQTEVRSRFVRSPQRKTGTCAEAAERLDVSR